MNDRGDGNVLFTDRADTGRFMHAFQKRNNLPITSHAADKQFSIEMETNTGKTDVHTKTIFERNRMIDEPQSVDNTPRSKEAVASFCVLRYSATQREKINLLYRLTLVDAYQMGLVKQISAPSNQVSGGFNQPSG